jgi:DNA-binding SARP family transcriptional activator
MKFGLLGPLVVRSGETVLTVPQGKQRAVLATLLTRAGQVIPGDELIDLIWDGRPPRSARQTMHNYIKRLRQVLGGPARAPIQTSGPGYVIQVDVHELDLTWFTELCEAGREAACDEDWLHAASLLHEALSLWRGYPLVDISCPPLTAREVPYLMELKNAALENRIDVDHHLGRHHQVIPELRHLVTTEPLRERLHALLMLALYRAGRQADALAAYQRARRALTGELGIEPGAELRRMHQCILAADPALDLRSV